MTGYKTILVPVSDGATGAAPLDAAIRLAAEFGSHLTALHVRTDPTEAVPLVGEGMSGALVEDMMTLAEEEAARRAEGARRAFDEACARHKVPLANAPGAGGMSAEYVDIVGREEECVAWRGRLSDMVVMGRPVEGAETPSLMTLNAALMESGKPTLLVPATSLTGIGGRIVVAWNGSAEAGRAVAMAMPLLERAAEVHVLSIAEDERTTSVPAGELCAYLAWHGIEARCHTLHAPGSQSGEALLREASARGADLLVMGAYTHSRLRQLILGGITRHVLSHAEVPCLLSH